MKDKYIWFILFITLILLVCYMDTRNKTDRSNKSPISDLRFMPSKDRNGVLLEDRPELNKEDESMNYLDYVNKILNKFEKNPPAEAMYKDCKLEKYIDGTVPENVIKMIDNMNEMFCNYIFRLSNGELHFTPTSLEEANVYTHEQNGIYQYQAYFHETNRNWSIKLMLEWITNKYYDEARSEPSTYIPNATKESVGYPVMNQIIPLPTEVIPSGKEILYPYHKHKDERFTLYLNRIQKEGTSLTLEYDNKCPDFVEPFEDKTSLESTPTDFEQTMYPYQETAVDYNKTIPPPNAPTQDQRKCMIPKNITKNCLESWNSEGVSTECSDQRDDHMVQPTSTPAVYSSPHDVSSYQWLYESHRDIPSANFARS
jgi:hypothetical protein